MYVTLPAVVQRFYHLCHSVPPSNDLHPPFPPCLHPSNRFIPDFARELDFLRLLPRGADIDPNDPRSGNVLRLRGLLSSLDLNRRESSVAGSALTSKTARVVDGALGSGRSGSSDTAGSNGAEDNGVFRASQQQQVGFGCSAESATSTLIITGSGTARSGPLKTSSAINWQRFS